MMTFCRSKVCQQNKTKRRLKLEAELKFLRLFNWRTRSTVWGSVYRVVLVYQSGVRLALPLASADDESEFFHGQVPEKSQQRSVARVSKRDESWNNVKEFRQGHQSYGGKQTSWCSWGVVSHLRHCYWPSCSCIMLLSLSIKIFIASTSIDAIMPSAINALLG
ncbi:hypothetical protein KQX54_019820 [Cotesia glomerata]|uniref:Uncharacterized protein n=1 Tax=Cotesia glomerata TaxID=32391 RepID=A0AAV7J209_COTGL|nr:hypothetical protein KQX54_019820 [Cotesia glomerata]